ncbi:MAG: hypothetical protein JWQ38_2090 [Flavipsychrobacter sp.]|nr:hypothetical protein [Flavipsychrobacter sp.]
MRNRLLLPRKCRAVGLLLLPFAIALLIAYYQFDFSLSFLKYHLVDGQQPDIFAKEADIVFRRGFSADYTGTVAMVVTFASLFMIAFARLQHEDEYVEYMRLRAMQLSVYANYLILVVTALVFFSTTFLMVMEINLFTILILFILIFNYSIHIKPKMS